MRGNSELLSLVVLLLVGAGAGAFPILILTLGITGFTVRFRDIRLGRGFADKGLPEPGRAPAANAHFGKCLPVRFVLNALIRISIFVMGVLIRYIDIVHIALAKVSRRLVLIFIVIPLIIRRFILRLLF